MADEDYERIPETLTLREVRFHVIVPGCRTETLTVVTTLTDPEAYSTEDIAVLYGFRWHVELNLRSIKTQLGMDVLRGQTVDVVKKEIAMHLLAYNLIRLLMWHAAREHHRDLHRLSFTGTFHRLRAALPLVVFHARGQRLAALLEHLVLCIADDQLPYRPNRIEPRRVKRKPKPYSLLVKPRNWYRHHPDTGSR